MWKEDRRVQKGDGGSWPFRGVRLTRGTEIGSLIERMFSQERSL